MTVLPQRRALPLRAGLPRAGWLIALTAALLLLVPLTATLAVTWLFRHLGFNLWFVVFGVFAAVAWGILYISVRIGLVASTDLIREATLTRAAGSVRVGDPTEGLHQFAAWIEQLEPVDAGDSLPELARLVDGAAAAFGLPAPERIMIARAGWSVARSPDGRVVAFGAGYLLCASLPEVSAELGRHLLLARARGLARTLRIARTLSTASDWLPEGTNSSVRLVYAPARAMGGQLRAHAERLAAEARETAWATTAAAAGEHVVATGAARADAAPQLWREHLGRLQREWTDRGAPVAPHATWVQAWQQIAPGREVVPAAWDLVDPVSLTGWTAPTPPSIQPPPIAAPTALAVLAGDQLEALVRRLDDDTAALYYGSVVNELYGEALDEPDADADELAPPVWSPSIAPTADVPASLEATIAELEHAMVRRDREGLELAVAMSESEFPVVRCLAAGVRWLCGDPHGAEAIAAAVCWAPRAASVLRPLSVPLRNHGEAATADLIDHNVQEAADALHRPFNTSLLHGRATPIQPARVPHAVAAAIIAAVEHQPGFRRVWIVDTAVADGEVQALALIVQLKFWTVRTTSYHLSSELTKLEERLRLVWPITRGVELRDFNPGRRFEIRRMVPLWQS